MSASPAPAEPLTPISHFGAHTAPDGVIYIHQGRTAVNCLGLKEPSPFAVDQRRAASCPHAINVTAGFPPRKHWDDFQRIFPDPLVELMLPVPKKIGGFVPFLDDPHNQLLMALIALSRMSSPVFPIVQQFTRMTKSQITAALGASNLAPLVLTGLRVEHQVRMYEIAQEALVYPRQVIFTGEPLMVVTAPLKRIKTDILKTDLEGLMTMPMESIGSIVLRRWARGEKIDGPAPVRTV